MELTIRLEEPRDYRTVEHLTREAFWDQFGPGCDEHLLAHKMRDVDAFVPELDYVAERDGTIVGNIMYTKSKVLDAEGNEVETLTFGPLSVLPEAQKQGVGAALVRHTVEKARALGYRAILIFGHPEYYKRFGFKNAETFGITTADGKNFDAFMALELYDGALSGTKGRLYYDPVYEIDPVELLEFEKQFPYKEKKATKKTGKNQG